MSTRLCQEECKELCGVREEESTYGAMRCFTHWASETPWSLLCDPHYHL